MRILVVERDAATAQSLELMLRSEGFNVHVVVDGEEALSLGKLYDYDAITIEVNLPDMSGFDVIRELRTAKVKSSIIVVSGLVGTVDIVKGLGVGADDYMTKPIHKDELVARVRAVVRRRKGHTTNVITTGDLVVNLDNRTVSVAGQPIHLTGKEYQMLELLSLRKGQTLSKDAFLNHIYGGRDEPEAKIVDVFICKLRKKLRAVGSEAVETVWGHGFTLRDPDLPKVESPSLAPEMTDLVEQGAPWSSPRLRDSDHVTSPPLAPL